MPKLRSTVSRPSHTAGLAAMHIASVWLDGGNPPFKFAVLFAPNEFYGPIACKEFGIVRPLDAQLYRRPIKVPMVIVSGAEDPWKDRAERTIALCTENKSFLVKPAGGHDVHGLVVKASVKEVFKMIRCVITMAKYGS